MTYHAHILRETQRYLLNRNSEEEKNDFFYRYHALMKEFTSKKPSIDRQSISLATIFIPSFD